MGTELTPSTNYQPQMDGLTEIMKKWLEGYLRNYVTRQRKAWLCWLHLGEYCYNTNFHMFIGMSLFYALYGYRALNFSDVMFGASKAPRAKDWI